MQLLLPYNHPPPFSSHILNSPPCVLVLLPHLLSSNNRQTFEVHTPTLHSTPLHMLTVTVEISNSDENCSDTGICFVPHISPHTCFGGVWRTTMGMRLRDSCCSRRRHRSLGWLSTLGCSTDCEISGRSGCCGCFSTFGTASEIGNQLVGSWCGDC